MIDAELDCPECGRLLDTAWQFYFGAKWDMPRYRIGDRIRWEGTCFGEPTMTKVEAIAYPDAEVVCPHCGIDDILASIKIEDSVIKGISFYKRSFFEGDVLYVGDERTPYTKTKTYDAD